MLDQILSLAFGHPGKSWYGFNDEHAARFGGSRPFVFPMPGTPCSREQATVAMRELVEALGNQAS